MSKHCQECNLPVVKCNALTIARQAAESYMRENGHSAAGARLAVANLIPTQTRLETALARARSDALQVGSGFVIRLASHETGIRVFPQHVIVCTRPNTQED